MTLRIGLIGSDNSHVDRFSEILNVEDHPSYWPGSGARVWAIWGPDPDRTWEGGGEVVEQCVVFVIPRDAERSNILAACTFGNGALVSLGLIGDGVYVFSKMAVGRDGIV